MRFIVSAVLCLFLTSLAGAASASGEAWVAAKTTTQVAYTLDKSTWIPLKRGMAVPNTAWISTGPRGRLQLVRGSESIAFQPNTLAAIITKGRDSSRKTEVVQQIGEISLEIEKRQRPHTTVQTPFLAAVVKGTQFTVKVGRANAAVAVERGLVQVTSFNSGERSDLGAGQGASVDASGMTVAGLTEQPVVTRVAPSRAVVPAVGAVINTTATADDATDATSRSQTTGNAGGNGNGSANSSSSSDGNSSDNGNGNGNAGGNSGGNGNAGGNGNGGGSENSNAGGNGNGNGNGNAGGNSKDKAKGKDKDQDDDDD